MRSNQLTLAEVKARNSQLGRGFDALGQPRALTSAEFFEISAELGANQDNPDYVRLFDVTVDWICRWLPVRSAVEIGSGPGYLLHRLNERGIRTIGCDGNACSRQFFRDKHPEHADCYRLDPFFEQDYPPVDMLISIEVFEHIPDAGLATLMSRIKSELKPRFVVFSSTPHHDPDPDWDFQWGHINIKSPAEWDRLFLSYGYHRTDMRPPVSGWATLYVDQASLSAWNGLLARALRLFKRLAG